MTLVVIAYIWGVWVLNKPDKKRFKDLEKRVTDLEEEEKDWAKTLAEDMCVDLDESVLHNPPSLDELVRINTNHDCLRWHDEGMGCSKCSGQIYPPSEGQLRWAKMVERERHWLAYVEFLGEEVSDLSGFAHLRGWACEEETIKRGKELREKLGL